MEPVSVEILRTGGHYPSLLEEHLQSQGAPVTSQLLSGDAEDAVDEPERWLPGELSGAEVVIAIALPAGVLAALPGRLANTHGKALLIPIECPTWAQPGLVLQVQRLCQKAGLEFAAPMPFCALTPSGTTIRRFCDQYGLGRPRLEMKIADGMVTEARCLRGAPCGLTHWVVEQLPGIPRDEVVERAQTLHHSRPCLASMVLVPEMGDTLMHVSMRLMKQAVSKALQRARGGSVLAQRP